MNIFIRQERPEDYEKTEKLVREAFLKEERSDQTEHLLVRRIRQSEAFIPELSLVAFDSEKEMTGHILLSEITITGEDKTTASLALAPMSVLPAHQKKGIGSRLIHEALEKAKELGWHSVIVLGHKDYYPKFGFRQAQLWNIRAPFDVPEEVFMALELTEHALGNAQGTVHYSSAFSE
ncbi:GNAT family N-acetyltransferase [Alkalicoccus halolimnae]|uniref:N-acetyltransferase n=1 Tax=Alkalicoccus halolimnae TaxID=1667239 RepID=A0A5C7F5B5_9BACI|nr:N-acetyltransferase [Alkalicoccus halolimnae]TXF85283.1 N-acetyltransferase [Alkalicoccus halolimnae]